MVGLVCIHLSWWPMGLRGDLQTTQIDTKTRGCSLQIDTGAPLLRTVPIQYMSLNWYLYGTLTPTSQSLVQEGTLQATQKETQTPTWPQNSLANQLSCL